MTVKENDGKARRGVKSRAASMLIFAFLAGLIGFGIFNAWDKHRAWRPIRWNKDRLLTHKQHNATDVRKIYIPLKHGERAVRSNALRKKSNRNLPRNEAHHDKNLNGASSMRLSTDHEKHPGIGRLIQFTVDNLDGEKGHTGTFTIQTEPSWAPIGASRLQELTEQSFFDGCRFFRVLPNFMAQFGIPANPMLFQGKFPILPDEPVKESNSRGTVSFATSGPNTRTTQLFINTNDKGNGYLDRQGFTPVGRVIEGMDVVQRLYNKYGEGAPSGSGPNQGEIQSRGNEYLDKEFPKLSFIVKAVLLH